MALLNDSVGFKKLDVRLVERNVTRGSVTQNEVDEALAKLPDDAANAEWVNIDSLIDDAE